VSKHRSISAQKPILIVFSGWLVLRRDCDLGGTFTGWGLDGRHTGDVLRIKFTHLDEADSAREFSFVIDLSEKKYKGASVILVRFGWTLVRVRTSLSLCDANPAKSDPDRNVILIGMCRR
jgi:hypothetical protein